MNFRRFAYNNVRRNGRAYSAYLLSSAFMVMIFFTYAVFIYHPHIKESPMGEMTTTGMTIATWIVYVFAFFFVLYSVSVFLKSRNREFGILTILGAESRQINRLVFLENMIIGIVAIVSGILSGLLLSKLFLLVSTRAIAMEDLPFYWPTKAIVLTASAFLLLFLVISLFTLTFIKRNQVLDLLTGTSKPKTLPKANTFLALFGAILLAVGYQALRVTPMSPLTVAVAAITGIAGTYFFYSQLSVWILRFLQRRRKLAWKGTNLLWISEMGYKLKDNARMLFLVTVVTSLACMCTGFVLSTQQVLRESFVSNPFPLIYTQFQHAKADKLTEDHAEIKRRLQAAGLSYPEVKFDKLSLQIGGPQQVVGTNEWMTVLSQSSYTALAAALDSQAAPIEIKEKDHAVLLGDQLTSSLKALNGKTLTLSYPALKLHSNDSITLSFTKRQDPISALGSGRVLIVQDDLYAEMKQRVSHTGGNWNAMTVYVDPGAKLPGKNDPETLVGADLKKWRDGRMGSNGYMVARASAYFSTERIFSMFGFIGIFLALIFSMASASFLYFKLYAELNADRITYRSLSKMGLSRSEMNHSATLQISLLFFIPIAVAMLQSLVVLGPLFSFLGLSFRYGPVLAAAGAFLAAQMVYFLIARGRYIRSINRTMV